MKAKLGDYVETERHGHKGKVFKKDHSFEDSENWFNIQDPPLKEKTKKEPWYHILIDGGGAVYVPESDIKSINHQCINIDNYYDEFYFNKN